VVIKRPLWKWMRISPIKHFCNLILRRDEGNLVTIEELQSTFCNTVCE
jgi:hypothetical protein